ncbi:MAG: hypothetical protein KJ040_02305 [Gammaproteobacteria bacterium]|nr:hypothetical protein [Gammaproteobacteria bacterium]
MFAATSGIDLHARTVELLTAAGFGLAGFCFWAHLRNPEVAWLLVGLVTFGMSFDFMNHVLGTRVPERKTLLKWYARLNFAALCFGIPFTAYAGSFVLAEATPAPLSTLLVGHWLPVLHGSVAFGLLFMFARYKEVNVNGAREYVLDTRHAYTKTIFTLRRILLAGALGIALTVVADGLGTPWSAWALAFTGVFVASIPLHILHKQIPSMVSELLTQAIAIYGCWVVFGVG